VVQMMTIETWPFLITQRECPARFRPQDRGVFLPALER
jgi:hypothetical protein